MRSNSRNQAGEDRERYRPFGPLHTDVPGPLEQRAQESGGRQQQEDLNRPVSEARFRSGEFDVGDYQRRQNEIEVRRIDRNGRDD